VRRAAVQITERWVNKRAAVVGLAELESDRDSIVAQQLVLTLGMSQGEARPLAEQIIQNAARLHKKNGGMRLAASVALWGQKDLPLATAVRDSEGFDPATAAQWQATFANWNRGITFPKDMDKDHQRLVRDGEILYYKSCVSCHGADGKGLKTPGTDFYLAPSLVDSPRVNGDAEQLVPILLHGLMGPLDGNSYQAGFMAPATALGLSRERDIAQVLSYIRYAWGGKGGPVTEAEVKAIKAATQDRQTPWTQADLEARQP
jgi:mono/diheme cytochrome c family protein